MTFSIHEIVLNAEAEAFISLLDGGTCELRTGTQPATVNDIATGTLLTSVNIPLIALDSPAVGGVATLAQTDEASVIADGTVGWARFKKSDSSTVFDGAVSEAGGGGDVIVTKVDVLIDDLADIISMSYTRD